MIGDLMLTFLLVLLNGYFVAAEFALVKVRASQLDILIQKGSKRAEVTRTLLEKLDAYLSATQLGITLASLALGAVGEEAISHIVIRFFEKVNWQVSVATVHSLSLPIALTLLTFFHVTIGEQIPKMIGIKYSMDTALFIAWPLKIFYFVFSPFIWLLNKASNIILRTVGITKVGEDEVHTEEELRLILTESEEGGAIKPSENELIQNVFDFDDRLVKQIMVPQNRVSAIDVELGRNDMIKVVIDEGYSRLPIYLGDIDNVIGVVHSKDLLKAVIDNKFKSIRDIMRPAHFIPESMHVNNLLRDFQKLHIQMAIVTNEFGATAGVVTMEDIIEELVGEIQDEHDEEKPTVEKKSETEYIVNAHSSISDVNEALPMSFPESPKYETVSGLINFLWGRIAGVNEKKQYGGYEITILQRKKQTVESVKLRVLEPNKVE
ncbi:MAG: HlyC/CorC family transporter [Bacteroidetes bacterium]|jgi:CBS domain containing-hemolysin-like protein|nr:HlyC/CorC family transporter [Bacteroidota bacterium]MDF2451012.1 HlyC/CorC family transporter [Bacteroidota bacterium]